MAVIFDRKSVHINLEFQKAVPDCYLEDSQRIDFHLTEGFKPEMLCKLTHGDALAAQGKIHISATKAELVGWDFGFIQVARANSISTFYAGRTRKEGSIILQTHIPPVLPKPMLLDGSSAANPWIRLGGDIFKPVITPTMMAADMADHPSSCASKVMRNDRTSCDNLLFHAITEYELWTTLCAKDPGGRFQQFAHFHWVVRWDQKFLWRGRSIMKGTSNSFIKHDAVVLGPPTEPGVLALLNSPADPVALVGFNNHDWRKNSPNCIENLDWFHNVPLDFFVP